MLPVDDMDNLETLRADLQTALDDVVERMGPTSPMTQILSHSLLRGDEKTLRATLAMCRKGGVFVRPTEPVTS